MTLEEARVLLKTLNNQVTSAFYCGDFWVEEGTFEAFEVADAALRGSQPDPDTGPEGSIRKREKMRSAKKETVDELARVIRKYWATGDTDILDLKHRKASELSEQAFGSDAKWLQFCDILNGAICLNRNVSNDTIYKIFGLLCIEVSAPVEAGVVAGPPDGMRGGASE